MHQDGEAPTVRISIKKQQRSNIIFVKKARVQNIPNKASAPVPYFHLKFTMNLSQEIVWAMK